MYSPLLLQFCIYDIVIFHNNNNNNNIDNTIILLPAKNKMYEDKL